MKLHPVAWLVWLVGVAFVALRVTSPALLSVALGALLLAHLASPPDDSPAGRAVRTFMLLGGVLLLVRLVMVGLLANPGHTTLFTLPRAQMPPWLGGFGLGGPVSAEVLVEGASEGLSLLLVLVAFGIFNAHADIASFIRMLPAGFRDAGLVVSIAVSFVPQVLRTTAEVREARRIRGENGLRRLAPSFVVPVLGLSLERAFLLAESMDARGYGRGLPPRSGRGWGMGGSGAAVAAAVAWIAGRGTAALLFALLAAALLAAWMNSQRGGMRATRLATPRWAPADSLTVVAVVLAGSVAAATPAYSAFPQVTEPPFPLPAAVGLLLLAIPGLSALRGNAGRARGRLFEASTP